jgi:phosphoribosylanthranilate isomerase
MTKIKICGITDNKNAILAANAGAWALGFIFVKNSPRFINPEKAAEIILRLPEKIEKIGVFANLQIENVINIVKTVKLSIIQLHGEESPEFCSGLKKELKKPIIKAFRLKDKNDLQKISDYKNIVDYILLDTFSEIELGGTGKVFDWNLAVEAKKQEIPLILAGGLNPENIISAIKTVHPFACDISSGVEAQKGIKDKDKIIALFNTVLLTDTDL